MKKNTMIALVNYLNGETVTNLDEIKAELEAELARNENKANHNREVYAEAFKAIREVLAQNDTPMTVADIMTEANLPEGFTAGKVQYGLRAMWADEIQTISGKPNTYALKA